MTDIAIDFISIISRAKNKLVERRNTNGSRMHIATADIEVLEKLHAASDTIRFFEIENKHKTHLFIPDAFSPFIINKTTFEAAFFNQSEEVNDKLIANHFYGDSLIVKFECHIEALDLSNLSRVNISKKSKNELVIPFHESKLKITY